MAQRLILSFYIYITLWGFDLLSSLVHLALRCQAGEIGSKVLINHVCAGHGWHDTLLRHVEKEEVR